METAELQKKPGVYPKAAVVVWVGDAPRGAAKRAEEQEERETDSGRNEEP